MYDLIELTTKTHFSASIYTYLISNYIKNKSHSLDIIIITVQVLLLPSRLKCETHATPRLKITDLNDVYEYICLKNALCEEWV